MGAYVRLSLNSRERNYLRMDPVEGVTKRPTASNLGIQLKGGRVSIVGGEKDGETIDGPIVKANQKVKILLGNVRPVRFHLHVASNPTLAAYGTVQHPFIIEPEDDGELALYFKADRQCDLSVLDWTIRLYLID